MDEIGSQHLIRFHTALRNKNKADRTVYNQHLRITGFLRYAGVNYKAWRLAAPRFEKKIPDAYSSDQVEELRKSAKTPAAHMLIMLLANTGLRDQELQHLEWGEVDLKAAVIKVQGKAGWNIKDYEQREIPIPARLLEALTTWKKRAKGKLVLPSATGRINAKYLPMLKTVAKRANVTRVGIRFPES